jgi:hypothetical protein
MVKCHKEVHRQITVGPEQSSMAGPSMYTEGINDMHVNLSWLKVEERLTASILVFVRGIDTLKAQSCLFKRLAHSSDTHAYPKRHTTRGPFTVPKSRTDSGKPRVLHRAMNDYMEHYSTSSNSYK